MPFWYIEIEGKLLTTFLFRLYTHAIVSVTHTVYNLYIKQLICFPFLTYFHIHSYISNEQMVYFLGTNDAGDLENVQIAYIANFSFQYVNNETDRTVFPG